MGFIISKRWG